MEPENGCFRKWWYPKMDGANHGKPYQNGMIWGYHYFRKHPNDGFLIGISSSRASFSGSMFFFPGV